MQLFQTINLCIKITFFYNIFMEPEGNSVNAQILIEVDGMVMHRFIKGEKNLFTSGSCKIAKIENTNQNIVYFINLNSFYYTLTKNTHFVRLVYDDTVSYLFPHFDNGLSSLTLLKASPLLHNFEEILTNAATLIDFQAANQVPETKAKIQEHSPNVEKEAIYCADQVKKTIKEAGKFLGNAFKTIGGYLSQGIKIAGDYLENKIDGSGEKDDVNPNTKEKWEKLKQGTNNFFTVSSELANKYITPVIEKGKEYTNNLAKKIDQSENQSIKYAKELVGASGQAINETFKGIAEGGSEAGKQFGNQTRKIVQKKYGDDYVKTFIDGQEKIEKKQEAPLQQKDNKEEQEKKKPEETLGTDRSSQQLYPKLTDQ